MSNVDFVSQMDINLHRCITNVPCCASFSIAGATRYIFGGFNIYWVTTRKDRVNILEAGHTVEIAIHFHCCSMWCIQKILLLTVKYQN
jgi:hypothetical protein